MDWANTIHKNENLDFECDLTGELPFGDGSFDTVILSDVLEHLPEPELLWGELARILTPGGRLLMNVPFFYLLHEIPFDFYRYSSYALQRFASAHGFNVLELRALGGSPEVITDIVAKHVQFIPWFGGPIARCMQAMTLGFTRTRFGQRLSTQTAERFPLGYAMVAEKIDPETHVNAGSTTAQPMAHQTPNR